MQLVSSMTDAERLAAIKLVEINRKNHSVMMIALMQKTAHTFSGIGPAEKAKRRARGKRQRIARKATHG